MTYCCAGGEVGLQFILPIEYIHTGAVAATSVVMSTACHSEEMVL